MKAKNQRKQLTSQTTRQEFWEIQHVELIWNKDEFWSHTFFFLQNTRTSSQCPQHFGSLCACRGLRNEQSMTVLPGSHYQSFSMFQFLECWFLSFFKSNVSCMNLHEFWGHKLIFLFSFQYTRFYKYRIRLQRLVIVRARSLVRSANGVQDVGGLSSLEALLRFLCIVGLRKRSLKA